MNSLSMQKNRMIYALRCLVSLLALSPLIHAQSQTGHEGWYQVEMIVFARKHDVGQEHWPSNIKLRYPNNWVELKNPNANTEADTVATNENSTGLAVTDAEAAVANSAIDLTKEAFYLLPQNERQLNAEAKKLTYGSRFEVLFHQAWRQVIGHKNNAKNIIINGGKQFGQHQELGGTINLSVATYLKLQTNLWFSQFDVNIGQEQTVQWPEIPVRPNYNNATAAALTLDSDVDLTRALAKENNAWANSETSTTDMQEAFITRQIIFVKQARDMRSNEVHYVDHPVVGIVIKITPYRTDSSVTQ